MFAKEKAQALIDHALSKGADFAEIFVEKNRQESLKIVGQDVQGITGGVDFGIGIRLIYGTQVLYGYTNSTELEELMRITNLIAKNEDPSTAAKAFGKIIPAKAFHPIENQLGNDFPLEQKLNYLKTMTQSMMDQGEKIVQANASSLQRHQSIMLFNSDGVAVEDERHYMRVVGQSVAQDGPDQTSGYEAPGAMQGWEFTNGVDPKKIGSQVAALALTKLQAKECPAGRMPVIIDNGFGGVIFHEACGHLLETTSVAKKASVFHDKMGEMIANPVVNAVDDGTIQNAWGSINLDDEGMATQHTQLIKDGKLESFLVDKVGAMQTGYERTGSGRRQSYKFAPASRMRNTFIEPGEHSLDAMISTIDKGIYCKKMGGGSVSPGTGEFNFASIEAYMVENGKVTHPLKAATLIGSGPEVLKQISMVGNNFELAAGMCGSVSGSIPTTVGQAAIKIDDILVGGQSA